MVYLKDKFTGIRTTPSIAPNNGENADDGKSSSSSVGDAEKPDAKRSLSISLPGSRRQRNPVRQKRSRLKARSLFIVFKILNLL